ncbi:MAG: hypothetical protein E6J08_08740 [Chloroflexi bacterium]|nr:MAG: hypothetical protein E6J08_08740 [Chloroflexota bacterium]
MLWALEPWPAPEPLLPWPPVPPLPVPPLPLPPLPLPPLPLLPLPLPLLLPFPLPAPLAWAPPDPELAPGEADADACPASRSAWAASCWRAASSPLIAAAISWSLFSCCWRESS